MIRHALFLSGGAADSRRYRVFHQAEALQLAGWKVRVRVMEGTWRPDDIEAGQLVVLHRVAWNERVSDLVDRARSLRCLLLFDTDDLSFAASTDAHPATLPVREPSTAGRVAPPSPRGTNARAERPAARAEDCRHTLEACDGILFAHEALRHSVATFGIPAAVTRDAIDLELLRLSSWARTREREPDRRVVIGFLSGDPAHDAAFEAAGEGIRRALGADPRLTLRVIGPLDLHAGAWQSCMGQVERLPRVSWRRLPPLLADLDTLLVPPFGGDPSGVVVGQRRCLEAGAVGVPTIAADTSLGVAHSADLGVLAVSIEQWADAIGDLAADARRRTVLGRAARAEVVSRHVTDVRASEIEAAVSELIGEPPAARIRRRPPTLARQQSTTTPEADARSAARQLITMLAEGLEAAEHANREPSGLAAGDESRESPRAQLTIMDSGVTGSDGDDVVLGVRAADIGDDRAAHSESGPTTGLTSDAVRIAADDGSLRYAMGPDPIAAARRFRDGPPTIALGPWLAAWMADRYGARTLAVPYPVDAAVAWPGPTARGPIVLCDLGAVANLDDARVAVQALDLLVGIVLETKVILVNVPYALRPLPPALSEASHELPEAGVAEYHRAAAVLVCCFTNLPLDVPFAMACGCVVVAPDVGPVRWLLVDGETASLAPPSPEGLAVAMTRVLTDKAYRRRLAEGAQVAVERLGRGRTADALAEAFGAAWNAASGPQPSGSAGDRPWSRQAEASRTILDHLQPVDDGPSARLGAGRAIGQTFRCRFDGLCAVDVLVHDLPLALPAPVALTLRPAPGHPVTLARVELVREALIAGHWARFEFEPVQASGGTRFYAELTCDAPADLAPSVGLAAGAVFPAGSTFVDGIPAQAAMAFRTFCRPGPAVPHLGADRLLDPVVRRLSVLDHAIYVAWDDLEADRATLPYRAVRRCVSILSGTLPPIERRPWPASAPVHLKLWKTVRHFGPLALAREAIGWLRWQRMSGAERLRAANPAAWTDATDSEPRPWPP